MSALAVGAGGAVGALSRYAVGRAIERRAVGTAVVNVAGSFLFGVALGLEIGGPASLAAAVGFCGAFTTFSSFAVDTVSLAEDGDPGRAALNAGGTLVSALVAVVLGIEAAGLI